MARKGLLFPVECHGDLRLGHPGARAIGMTRKPFSMPAKMGI